MYSEAEAKERLEYLRGEIRAERISYGEIAELQALSEHIDEGDAELLELARPEETQEESSRSHGPKIIVVVEGGVVQSVDIPAGMTGVEVEVRDYDTDGCDHGLLITDDNGDTYISSLW